MIGHKANRELVNVVKFAIPANTAVACSIVIRPTISTLFAEAGEKSTRRCFFDPASFIGKIKTSSINMAEYRRGTLKDSKMAVIARYSLPKPPSQ